MANSDYLFKAAIKKVSEKVNEILVEKIEEATNIAQDAPIKIKKELNKLKESILEEAERIEFEENANKNSHRNTNEDNFIANALKEIEIINREIEQLNKKINSQI